MALAYWHTVVGPNTPIGMGAGCSMRPCSVLFYPVDAACSARWGKSDIHCCPKFLPTALGLLAAAAGAVQLGLATRRPADAGRAAGTAHSDCFL